MGAATQVVAMQAEAIARNSDSSKQMDATWRTNAVTGKVKYCGFFEQQQGRGQSYSRTTATLAEGTSRRMSLWAESR